MLEELNGSFKRDRDGVWVPRAGRAGFGYTDGAWVERYLERAFKQAKDLSSESAELEEYIKDWNTEYHLTRKRKDLLAGLTHNRSAKVLEIGCGCGAITRYLGEQYASVIAVEGSYNRARLARLRTADLESVEVIASRYQEIGLDGSFDIVFCVGVLEYAPTYVDADDPFRHALESMKRMLKPGGSLVIAIENKLGLKYFSNSREDHSGTFFEGIEGYPRYGHVFETFGKRELDSLLKEFWPTVDFYYPFPDYKLPQLLISEHGLTKINPGEMIASLTERDYAGSAGVFFDNRLAWKQIAGNGLAGDMSNSFLAIAGGDPSVSPSMEGKFAVLFNRDRRKQLSSETTIFDDGSNIVASKELLGGPVVESLNVRMESSSSQWVNGDTIAFAVFKSAHSRKSNISAQLEPVRIWWRKILEQSNQSADGPMVDGRLIDAIWHNAFQLPNNDIVFFDNEMIWREPIPAKDLFLRAALHWTKRFRKHEMPALGSARAITAVRQIARELDIPFSFSDVLRVARREASLQSEIGLVGAKAAFYQIMVQAYFPYHEKFMAQKERLATLARRARNLLRRIVGA